MAGKFKICLFANSINYGNRGILGITEHETIQWRKGHHKPDQLESTD